MRDQRDVNRITNSAKEIEVDDRPKGSHLGFIVGLITALFVLGVFWVVIVLAWI